jgi:hypothetical protein
MILCLRPVRGPGPTFFNSVFVGCDPRAHQIMSAQGRLFPAGGRQRGARGDLSG